MEAKKNDVLIYDNRRKEGVFPGLSKGIKGMRNANIQPNKGGDGRVVPKYTNKYFVVSGSFVEYLFCC